MKGLLLGFGVSIAAVAAAPGVRAAEMRFAFTGSGVSGSGALTYGPSGVAGDPAGAFAVTGITGTFSDSSLGLHDVAITGLAPIAPGSTPPPAPFPASMSEFAVTNPTPPATGITYDNLLYPGGSPWVCPDYSGYGGYLDVYGLLLTLGNGYFVNIWSNGVMPGATAPLGYGVAVIDANRAIRAYHADGVALTAVPEPASMAMLGVGLSAALALSRRRARGASI